MIPIYYICPLGAGIFYASQFDCFHECGPTKPISNTALTGVFILKGAGFHFDGLLHGFELIGVHAGASRIMVIHYLTSCYFKTFEINK